MIYISVFDNLLIGLNIAVSVCLPVIPFLWCCMTMFSSCCNNSETNVEDASESWCSFYTFFYAVGGKTIGTDCVQIKYISTT